MNKNINLCEILKGHEGETFYSPTFGIAILKEISNDYLRIKSVDKVINLCKDGKYDIYGECILFPSKNQRDWNKWVEENKPKNKPKVPKTWSELVMDKQTDIYTIQCNTFVYKNNPNIIKSALAFHQIHQLIEVGYGGNISSEEWNNNEWKFTYQYTKTGIDIISTRITKYIIAFHTKKQAEEFLSYPENIQLLKDYFMINE